LTEEDGGGYRVSFQKPEELVEERTAKLQQALLVLKKSHLDTVKALAGAIDAKDPILEAIQKGSGR